MGLRPDGTVVAAKYTGDLKDYCGQCDVSGWKLFNNADNYEEECKKAVEERKERERIAEEERQKKIAELTRQKAEIEAELPNLQGLFKSGRRKEAEERLARIKEELNRLSK